MNDNFDVSVLSLKRWNFPQTIPLCKLPIDPTSRKNLYVSYQSHHFIEIAKAEDTHSPNPILQAYNQLKTLRKHQWESIKCNVHTVQNMVVMGPHCEFWDYPANVLNITFIQMASISDWSFDDLKAEIGSTISKCACNTPAGWETDWTLCYSLDFCDLVLFAKNFSQADFQKILWELALIRSEKTRYIRDTFTIYSFGYNFLIEAFRNIENGVTVSWPDHIALSADLSIQSIATWTAFQYNLKDKISPHPKIYQLPGRNDARIVTDTLPGEKILYILYALDKYATVQPNQVWGGYEVTLIADYADYTGSAPLDTELKLNFAQSASSAIETLLTSINYPPDDNSADYAKETAQSLIALLNNGFSDEFVISVLLSFISFLSISSRYRNEYLQLKQESGSGNNSEQQIANLGSDLDKMTRSYFSALNTLALSTMHNERQFIQAPAFNATYFDVPPKLAAFYSAIAYRAVQLLKFEGDADYRFIITPDYRKDINVTPLELRVKENPPEHLAVVCLCEEFFYDPVHVIYLLCHETGHYVGNRQRQMRAQYIFRSISYNLLCQTALKGYIAEDNPDICSLIAVLAEDLSNAIRESFDPYNCKTRSIPYHLQDIANYLDDTDYGFELFLNVSTKEHVIESWQRALDRKKDDQSILTAVSTCVADILSPLYFADSSYEMQCDILTRRIAWLIEVQHGKHNRGHADYCEAVLGAFSESFADLQIAEILGTQFDIDRYEAYLVGAPLPRSSDNLSSKNLKSKNLETTLRHDAFLESIQGSTRDKKWTSWHSNPDEPVYSAITKYTISQITEYLKGCQKSPSSVQTNEISDIIPALCSCNSNIQKQHLAICKFVNDYRDQLICYCAEISTPN